MDDLRDKVAVVTGAGSGIGRGIALALAEAGTHVAVADVEGERARAVAREVEARGPRALAHACDVRELAQVEALAEAAWARFGRVELLFNNAGVNGGGALVESTPQDLAWIFSVNVFGVWHGCRAFVPRMLAQGGAAHVVNTGSEHSLGVPHLFSGFYTASKHAVLALSDVLRRELPAHVGVSVLCPGVVRTDLWNAGRHRPPGLGGPMEGTDFVRRIMAEGLDPEEIGRRAVAGVRRGDFFILTHPHARRYAEERWEELRAAFEAQAPMRPGDERLDVMEIVRRLS